MRATRLILFAALFWLSADVAGFVSAVDKNAAWGHGQRFDIEQNQRFGQLLDRLRG